MAAAGMLAFLASARDYWSISLPLAVIGLLLAWGLGRQGSAARPAVGPAHPVEYALQEAATPQAV